MNYELIGMRLRQKRKELNLTQEKIAEYVGITPSFYSHIENGNKKAGLATFVKIAEFMKVSLDYVILGIDEQKETVNPCDVQLTYRIQSLSDKEKMFLLDSITSLEKLR